MNKITLYLYKPLLTLDHFSQLKNYMDQKVWFSPLEKFNDPFEAQFYLKHATPNEILANKATFDRYYCHVRCMDPRVTEEDFRKELIKPEASEMIRKMRLVEDYFKSHGAICLTSSSTNIPMWAHYAEDHQGYCVIFEIDLDKIYERYKELYKKQDPNNEYTREEFDIIINKVFNPYPDGDDQEILSFNQSADDPRRKIIFTKVIYQDIRPVVDEITLMDVMPLKSEYEKNKYLSQNSFGVKFREWGYENEYRLVVNSESTKCGLMDLTAYPFIRITGIIMGYKIGQNLSKDALDFITDYELSGKELKGNCIDDKVKEYVAQLAKRHDVKIYLAECSSEKYEITYKEYKQL